VCSPRRLCSRVYKCEWGSGHESQWVCNQYQQGGMGCHTGLWWQCLVLCIAHGAAQLLRGTHVAAPGTRIDLVARTDTAALQYARTLIGKAAFADVGLSTAAATVSWPVSPGGPATLYFDPFVVPTLEDVALRCAAACELFNVLSTTASVAVPRTRCTHVEVQTTECAGSSTTQAWAAEFIGIGDTSKQWCTLLSQVALDGSTLVNGSVVIPPQQPLPVPRATLQSCVGVLNPRGTECTPGTTTLTPSVPLIVLARLLPDYLTRAYFPMFHPDVYAFVWREVFNATVPSGAFPAFVTRPVTGMSDLQARYGTTLTTITMLERVARLVPGACYCSAGMGVFGPTCAPEPRGALSQCAAGGLVGALGQGFTAWPPLAQSTGGGGGNANAPQADLGQPIPYADGSWDVVASGWGGFATPVCSTGSCTASGVGPWCNDTRCDPASYTTYELARCGGPGAGMCTTALPVGCECATGSNLDPRMACSTCLPGYATVGSVRCAPVQGACFPTEGPRDVWTPVTPCSGNGACAEAVPGTWRCLCRPGWTGRTCASPVTRVGVLGGVVRTGADTTATVQRLLASSTGADTSVCGSAVLLHRRGVTTPEQAEAVCIAYRGAVASEPRVSEARVRGAAYSRYAGYVRSWQTLHLEFMGGSEVPPPYADTEGGVFCEARRCIGTLQSDSAPPFRARFFAVATPLTLLIHADRATVARFLRSDGIQRASDDPLVSTLFSSFCARRLASRELRLVGASPQTTLEDYLVGVHWLAGRYTPNEEASIGARPVAELLGLLSGDETVSALPLLWSIVVDGARTVVRVQLNGTRAVVGNSVPPWQLERMSRSSVRGVLVMCESLGVSPSQALAVADQGADLTNDGVVLSDVSAL
jgi:hypothetical protein